MTVLQGFWRCIRTFFLKKGSYAAGGRSVLPLAERSSVKMAGNKIARVTEDVHRELTAILREVKDPRVKDCLLSVVRVEVTNDLSYCTVYASTMEGMERTKTAVQGLKSAGGYIRRELGRRLKLRHVPELIFKATDSIAYGASISRMLQDLSIPEEDPEEEEED